MAFDERLADRIREQLGPLPGITEKRMFGGIAFLLDGNMTAGVRGDELIARVGPEVADPALARPGIGPFASPERPMRGWLLVGPSLLEGDGLAAWIADCVDFARTLPPKPDAG